jgi:hypothetical protein
MRSACHFDRIPDALVFLIMTDFTTGMAPPTLAPADTDLTVHHGLDVRRSLRNADVDWDLSAPQEYWELNYRTMRNDDQSILQAVGGFFSRHFQNVPRAHLLRALDVGSGANLYPALAMLPWSTTITLTDVSAADVAWLRTAAAGADAVDDRGRWVWAQFWAEYARYPAYQQVGDPRAELAARHEVRHRGVLELAPEQWDLGTMFFVAESSTSDVDEFRAGTGAFLQALVPGAPFAAAFMDRSVGYTIANRSYPAVRAVAVPLIREVLAQFSVDASVFRVDVPAYDPVGDGYEGMIVAVGTTSARPGGAGSDRGHPSAGSRTRLQLPID